MNILLRRSTENDLDLLERIEKASFQLFQQSSLRTLRLSLKSLSQEVWLADIERDNGEIECVGCMILYLHKKSLRIFSVAVLPEFQGIGAGYKMVKHAENLALAKGYQRVTLEVDVKNTKLIEWYGKLGYQSVELLKDYYEDNRHALKMVLELESLDEQNRLINLVVVDDLKKWNLQVSNVKVISSKEYISNDNYYSNKKIRVFNLCNSYRYQSMGYYVSLLASARDHRAIPNVTTIRDFQDVSVVRSIADDIDEIIQKSLQKITEPKFSMSIYFGQSKDSHLKVLAQKIYQMFEAPFLQVQFVKGKAWEIKKISPISLNRIDPEHLEEVKGYAKSYFETKRFIRTKLINYKYDLAILVNPDEKNPPSNASSLKKFKQAAEDLDVYVEFITKDDYNKLYEYDALFIRETTDVNNYTYQFARKAYAEGLVVIDDPWSILRCSNKIFLNERLKNNQIKTPLTKVYYKDMVTLEQLQSLNFPLILKQPDSAFSLGVTKVNNAEEMHASLIELFKKSDLIIAQEFMPSDYDWRIGVLDNQPLFACKYYMAKGHWQIYNWKGKVKDQAGNAETVPIHEVPPKVLQMATKAASLMGDGLYGVDLKMVGDKVYVIEVNDNPNIDTGVEDKVLGKELYKKIILSIVTRIEMSRNIDRFVSVEPD